MSLESNLEKMQRMYKAARGKKRAAGKLRMEDEAGLIPEIIAETVIEEVVGHIDRQGLPAEAERVWNDLESLATGLVNYANSIYANNAGFRKKLKARGNKGRDTLYAFMRHWLASDLRKKFPAAFRALPERFAMGEEIR